MRTLKIDSEFQSLIPPLSDDEYKRLEKSILAEGVREMIITWNGTIIDGHNRYRICKEHDVNFKTLEREFDSREAAKIWIIENQFGRRNINSYVRGQLVLQLKELYTTQAKNRMSLGGGDKKSGVQKSSHPIEDTGKTRDKIAKLAGVSHDTIYKVEVIETEAANGNEKAAELRQMLISGEKKSPDGKKVSINSVYNAITSEKPKSNRGNCTDDGRRICSICGEPINPGDYYESKPNLHKRCHEERCKMQRYKNPDISLIENVAVYSIDSFLAELTASAENLRDAWVQSIEINQSMGVKLKAADKRQLNKAAENLLDTIQKIRERNGND